jgi:choice-of-anchor A domain-containing protein
MRRRKRPKWKTEGSAMPLAMVAILILFVMGAGLLSLGLRSRLLALRAASDIVSRCAADAGVTKAVYEMNEKLKAQPWDDSTLPQAIDEALPNCDAVFGYIVTGDLESGYGLQAVGSYLLADTTVNCNLPLEGPFEYAIFTQNGIVMNSGTTVTWYNYGDDEGKLSLGTNSILDGAVDLKNAVYIDGNIVVGPGGDPDVVINGTWATITGTTSSATRIYELSPITLPVYLQELPSQGTLSESTVITTSATYDAIDLSHSKVITVDGPVALYVIGDLTLSNSAELQVVNESTNPDASLIVYLGGDIEVKNSGAINNLAEDPGKVKIYGLDGCQDIVLKNGTDFYGAIYAPNADVVMMNSGEVFGSVVSKSFDQRNSATFNYDASLRDVSTDDEVIRFVVEDWSEE